MADTNGRTSGDRRKLSRLQRRAPSSIQISKATDWNVAIPLLSPLVQSPTSPNTRDPSVEIKSRNREKQSRGTGPEKPPVVFKMWQHPAAPFCHDPAPLVPFVGLRLSSS